MGMNELNFAIDVMKREDWPQVRAIFSEGLATGLAAFMLSPPRWLVWNNGHLNVGRSVARANDGHILGWSALAPVPDN